MWQLTFFIKNTLLSQKEKETSALRSLVDGFISWPKLLRLLLPLLYCVLRSLHCAVATALITETHTTIHGRMLTDAGDLGRGFMDGHGTVGLSTLLIGHFKVL